MVNKSRLLLAALILATTSLAFGLPAKAEGTYNASCNQRGDGFTITSTGELILVPRLVEFRPTEAETRAGQRGICVIKYDPPGYKWISCWKKDGRLVTLVTNEEYPKFINPTETITSWSGPGRWSGTCKVKL